MQECPQNDSLARCWAVVKEFHTYCITGFHEGEIEQGGLNSPVLPLAHGLGKSLRLYPVSVCKYEGVCYRISKFLFQLSNCGTFHCLHSERLLLHCKYSKCMQCQEHSFKKNKYPRNNVNFCMSLFPSINVHDTNHSEIRKCHDVVISSWKDLLF